MEGFRPVKIRKVIALSGISTALIIGLLGCGTAPKDGSASERSVSGVQGPVAGLDRAHPADLEFYRALRLHGARWPAPPASVAEASEESRLVVVAEVSDVRHTRTIGEGTDAQPMVGLVLDSVQVLRGTPVPELKELIVEVPGTSAVNSSEAVASLREKLPEGRALWFLNWLGNPRTNGPAKAGAPPARSEDKKFYYLIHPDGGLVLQGQNGLVTPLSEGEAPGGEQKTLRGEMEKLDKLSQLVAAVEKS